MNVKDDDDILPPEWKAESLRRIRAENRLEDIQREREANQKRHQDELFSLKVDHRVADLKDDVASLKDDIAALTANVNMVAKLVADMSGAVAKIAEHMAAPKVTVAVRDSDGDIQSTITKTIVEPRDE